MANAKKDEPRKTKEEAKSEEPTCSSPPVFLYHPSLVPFVWPCTTSSNFIHFQYLPHSDATTSSDFSWADTGNPLFLLPIPLALPFPIYGIFSDTKMMRHNETPSSHQCLSPQPNLLKMASSNDNCTVMPEKLSCVKPVGPSGDNISTAVAVMEETEAVICSHEKAENVFTATRARRRRKEVMMLKTRTHTANSSYRMNGSVPLPYVVARASQIAFEVG